MKEQLSSSAQISEELAPPLHKVCEFKGRTDLIFVMKPFGRIPSQVMESPINRTLTFSSLVSLKPSSNETVKESQR